MISDRERARRKINKHPRVIDSKTGCVLALTCIQANGYVKIRFKGKYVYLHRLVAFFYLGLDLSRDKILVLHKRNCPNRHCFNEDHLYIGDSVQNANDYVAIGKHHEANRIYCDKGHKLDRIMFTQRDGPVRYCSTCRKEAKMKLQDKKNERS